MAILCDVCSDPGTSDRPLVRVYDATWSPLDVHDDCWPDDAQSVAYDLAVR